MDQLNMFDSESITLQKINDSLLEICKELDFDYDTFKIINSKSKNITIKAIVIVEKPYPMSDLNKNDIKESSFMRFDIYENSIELFIRIADYDNLKLDYSSRLKPNSTDNLYYHFMFNLDDDAFLSAIKTVAKYSLTTYRSSETFGCCAMYKQCSDAKHCLHENKLHATACEYKHHLDAGRIFY